MEKYKKSAIKLIKNPSFIVPIVIVAIASYGYLLGHSTINVDVLAADRYFQGMELVAQGRIVLPILEKILKIFNFYPFLVDFIAVLFFIFDILLYCSIFDVMSKNKIKPIAYTVFACIFISYPLIMEYFTFVPLGLSCAMAFALVAISIILFNECLISKRLRFFFSSIFTLWMSISIYESFAVVYIMAVLLIILIKILFSNKEKVKLRKIIIYGLQFAIPLMIAVLFNIVLVKFALNIFHIKKSDNAAKIVYYERLGVKNGIQNLFNTIIIEYIINGLGYLPIANLVICSIISFIIGIVFSIKKKDFSILFIILGMNLTLILLSIIQGGAAFYRTCQQFQLFVAFIFMLLTQLIIEKERKKIEKYIFFIIMSFIIFNQVKDIYKLEYLNDLRYQAEKEELTDVANELVSKYDTQNKPVAFFSYDTKLPTCVEEAITVKPNSLHYKVLKYYSEKILNIEEKVEEYQYIQSALQSCIQWSTASFMESGKANEEILKYFKLLGYDFKSVDSNLYLYNFFDLLSQEEEKEIPKWPKKGYIIEKDDIILVKL